MYRLSTPQGGRNMPSPSPISLDLVHYSVQSAVRFYLHNLTVDVTVEATILIGLIFLASASFIFLHCITMARKRKSGLPKPPQSTGPTPVAAPKGADANGSAPAGSAPVVAPVVKELDSRPETS
jgi:hypothetical protein